MKKLLSILCVLATLLSLCACQKPTEEQAATTAPTEPQVTAYPYREHYTKNGVQEFLALLDVQDPVVMTGPRAVDEDNCNNVTPPEVAAQTKMQIFNTDMTGLTFILLDGQIYKLGGSFQNAVPCDFDGDGKKDLLLVLCWGSGNNYTNLIVFNSVTKTSKTIHKVSHIYYPRAWFVATSGADIYFEGMAESDKQLSYPVLRLKYEKENNKIVRLVVEGIDGHIQVKDGVPQFVPYGK